MNNELLLTAIHEAGHAVAHARLEVLQALVTIKPHNGMLGRSLAEGKDHVSNAEDARVQVLCYCAGYAALIAAGYSDKSARLGADDDFENAAELVSKWPSIGKLDEAESQAVIFMSTQENIRAVDFVAKALLEHETLDFDYLEMLIELADGNISEAEWQRFLLYIYPRIRPQKSE